MPWEAAVRELKEETGLEIALRRLVGIYTKRRQQDLVFVFAAAVVGGELRASDERDRLGFLDPHQLPEQTSDRERIADALAAHAAPVLAVQRPRDDEPPAGTR